MAGGGAARPQGGIAANPVQQQVPAAKAATYNAKTNPSKSFNPIQVASKYTDLNHREANLMFNPDIELVAQHIPQLSSSMNAAPSAPTTQPAGQTAGGAAPPPAAQNNNPFMNQQQQPQQVAPNGTLAQAPASAPPLECLIPGCGKPVHIDTQGNTTSDYCSRTHRE